MYLRYLLCFIPHSIVMVLCYVTNPIVCMFITKTGSRDDLIPLFKLWGTYDNHVDSYWYDKYGNSFNDWTYTTSAWTRYKYRVMWLARNTGYGWSYLLFSIPHGTGFQWKGQTKPIFGHYNDYNIGWKSHYKADGTLYEKDDFAARIIGIRKVK